MPNNVVKTKEDERLWEKAKERAKEEGQAENWAYVMGIYKRMNPDRFDKSAADRVAEAFLARQAYDEVGRDPDEGWQHGKVEPFEGTVGEGSQTPPAHDHQGAPVDPPEFPPIEVPGYEWHEKAPKVARDRWAGVDTRSFASRVLSWWDDLEALVREYWSLSPDLKVTRSKNKLVFSVNHLGPMSVEVVGPPTSLKVYVGGASNTFDATTSLYDILMWIEGVPRNRGFRASDGRTAAASFDLDRAMKATIEKVTRTYSDTGSAMAKRVELVLRSRGFQASDVQLQLSRGHLFLTGRFVDQSPGTWRSREEVEQQFQEAFGTSGQLRGASPEWEFYVGDWFLNL